MRLTMRDGDCNEVGSEMCREARTCEQCEQFLKILDKLAAYENAEEKALLEYKQGALTV